MKKLSELSKDTLIVIGEFIIGIIPVEEINNYRDEIINKGLKCYLVDKIEKRLDTGYIEEIIDDLNDNLQANDDLLDDEYLEATEEEKEELYNIFNNMLRRTSDIYKRGEEVKVDIF